MLNRVKLIQDDMKKKFISLPEVELKRGKRKYGDKALQVKESRGEEREIDRERERERERERGAEMENPYSSAILFFISVPCPCSRSNYRVRQISRSLSSSQATLKLFAESDGVTQLVRAETLTPRNSREVEMYRPWVRQAEPSRLRER